MERVRNSMVPATRFDWLPRFPVTVRAAGQPIRHSMSTVIPNNKQALLIRRAPRGGHEYRLVYAWLGAFANVCYLGRQSDFAKGTLDVISHFANAGYARTAMAAWFG